MAVIKPTTIVTLEVMKYCWFLIFKMVTLATNWLRHFRLLFHKYSMQKHQTFQKCSFIGVLKKCCYYFVWIESQITALVSDYPKHFRLLLQNFCMASHQKCFSGGCPKVLLLFFPTDISTIQDGRWLSERWHSQHPKSKCGDAISDAFHWKTRNTYQIIYYHVDSVQNSNILK